MRNFVIPVVLILFLASCAGSASVRSVAALSIACDTYATTLDQVTDLQEQGLLTEAVMVRVDRSNEMAKRACAADSTLDPSDAVNTVDSVVDLLRAVKDGV